MIKTVYLSPSEARELSLICSTLDALPAHDEREEFEESEYRGRSAYALASRFQFDPEAFEEGEPLFGLHHAHAGQVASLNRSPLGWRW